MNAVLWIVQALLAATFLFTGLNKVVRTKEQLGQDPSMAWTEDFTAPVIRTVGGLEIAAAIGLILPGVTGIATILTPLAASGLSLLMIGAAIVHHRRGEQQAIPFNIVIALLAALVAWGRFGPYAF